jgi:Flp pilus assembly protein TadG
MTGKPVIGKTTKKARPATSAGFMTRLAGDRRGVSAVEFALIAPIMISFYFGLAEFCQGYMSQKRLAHSASAVADLVAQTDVVTKDELDDVLAISALIMKPFSTTTLTTRVSSVTRDAKGVAKVDWSRASGITAYAAGATVTVPTDMIANGESLVMGETTYDYASPVKYLMPAVTKFSSVFYERPRRVEKVGCSNC